MPIPIILLPKTKNGPRLALNSSIEHTIQTDIHVYFRFGLDFRVKHRTNIYMYSSIK